MAELSLSRTSAVITKIIVSNSSMPDVVGAAPQWGDDDDATYGVAVNDSRGQQWPEMPIDAIGGVSQAATPVFQTQIRFYARVSTSAATISPFTITLYSADNAFVLTSSNMTATAIPAVYEETKTVPDASTSALFSKLSAGELVLRVEQLTNSTTSQDTLVYEASATIIYQPLAGELAGVQNVERSQFTPHGPGD